MLGKRGGNALEVLFGLPGPILLGGKVHPLDVEVKLLEMTMFR